MDEAIAYSWAGKCLTPLQDGILPHRLQQVGDLMASALVEATRPLEAQVAQLRQERDACRHCAHTFSVRD